MNYTLLDTVESYSSDGRSPDCFLESVGRYQHYGVHQSASFSRDHNSGAEALYYDPLCFMLRCLLTQDR